MGNLIDILFIGPIGLIANSTANLFNWVGSCMDGECSATPSDVLEIFTGIGDSFGSTVGLLKSAASQIILNILSVLPDSGGFPTQFDTAFSTLGGYLATVNFILPVSTLIYCISFVLALRMVIWGVHIMLTFAYFVRGVEKSKPTY